MLVLSTGVEGGGIIAHLEMEAQFQPGVAHPWGWGVVIQSSSEFQARSIPMGWRHAIEDAMCLSIIYAHTSLGEGFKLIF